MVKPQHLSRAPITEALIDLRVTLPNHTREVGYLKALDEKFQGQYPDKKTMQELRYEFELAPPHAEKASTTPVGFRYTNAENTQVIQATLNGLTFSRLPPYEDWTKLRAEAKRVWQIYSEHLHPETITRVSARYINKLTLPSPLIDFDRYLRYVPRVPEVLPQVVGGFFSRIVVPDQRVQCTAIITLNFQPGPSEIAVILDIDVFREKVFADEQDAWATIDTLRDFKNMIFFDSITDETVALYK